MNILKFFFLISLTSMFYSTNVIFSEIPNNPTPKNDNDNQDIIKFFLTLSGIIIPVGGSIYLGFRQYRKEKEKQLLEYKKKLEFEYDVDLRKKRITAYEGLWELTKIDFDENTPKYKIEIHESRLNGWYYTKGQGMLLTESSQKLYHNYKKKFEEFREDLETKINCETCLMMKEIIGKCEQTDCKERKCRLCEINFLKKIASAFRTNLLKDIGTREELKNPSPYYEIYIKDMDKDISNKNPLHLDKINFIILFIGNESIKLQNKEIWLIIKNLDRNQIVNMIQIGGYDILEPGREYFLPYDVTDFQGTILNIGNYSVKVVANTTSTEREFHINKKESDVDKKTITKIQIY